MTFNDKEWQINRTMGQLGRLSKKLDARHHGECSAEWKGTDGDGECYECMFYVDDDCGYLIRGSVTKAKSNE